MGAGFAAGIGAGIAIGIATGQKTGQDQVCGYIEKNGLVIFDQEGNRVSVEELRKISAKSCGGSCNRKTAVSLVIAGLISLLVAGVAIYMVFR